MAGPRGARDVPQKPVIPVCSGRAGRGREGARGAPPVRDTPCTSMGLGVGWGGSTVQTGHPARPERPLTAQEAAHSPELTTFTTTARASQMARNVSSSPHVPSRLICLRPPGRQGHTDGWQLEDDAGKLTHPVP